MGAEPDHEFVGDVRQVGDRAVGIGLRHVADAGAQQAGPEGKSEEDTQKEKEDVVEAEFEDVDQEKKE